MKMISVRVDLDNKISSLERKYEYRNKTSVIWGLLAHARDEWSVGNYLQTQIDLAAISKLEHVYL